MAQWLEYWSFTGATRVRFPAMARDFFQLCFTLLRLSCRKNALLVAIFIYCATLLYKWDFHHNSLDNNFILLYVFVYVRVIHMLLSAFAMLERWPCHVI